MKNRQEKVYAFIDSQNINLGVRSQGWILDWSKFRQYLRNKYNVEKAFLFIGYVETNQKLYDYLKNAGFTLIFKPTLKGKLPYKTKNNVDAELVLHTMIEFPNFDKAIIVSGDGDFHCLVEHLEEKEKLLRICTPNRHYSRLLRRFNNYIVRLDLLKNSLQ